MSLHFRIALLALAAAAAAPLMAQQMSSTEKKPSTPEWVQRSNQDSQVLLKILAKYNPEAASFFGVTGVDDQVIDLKPQYRERLTKDVRDAVAQLEKESAQEKDPAVQQDLEILIKAGNDTIKGAELEQKYELPYYNVTQTVFQGIHALLDDQVEPERRKFALDRLKKYAGMAPGSESIVKLAEDRTRERFNAPGLEGPFKGEMEKNFGNDPTYIAGIGQLFDKYKIPGYEPVYAKLKEQLAEYDQFLHKELLPKARADFRMPPELYAFALDQYGNDMQPAALASMAHDAFDEIQNEMMALAPEVARQHGFQSTDYRDVIRDLKKDQWTGESILPNYEKRIKEIEEIIRRERLVTMPDRPLEIKLASAAETAATPAPHMKPPRLIGNTGQHGTFMLPLETPPPAGAKPEEKLKYDDFTFNAASWTLTAHEGRPGHELQFDAMVEKGVSTARALFALNSVNVEGWGLYSEAILKPYMPPDGQLISLQHRLMRAARAFLDPELQMGKTTPEAAKKLLMDDVVLSEAMANQEVERYTFWAPGQAPSYFYGYTKMMRLRADTEKEMGPRFDQLKFHDFVLDQGALPPKLLRKAVMDQFVGQKTEMKQAN